MAAKHIVLTEKNGGMKDLMEKYYNMIYYCAYKNSIFCTDLLIHFIGSG